MPHKRPPIFGVAGRKTSPSAAERERISKRMRDPAFRAWARLESSPDHVNAKRWTVTSPDGAVYKINNLMIWARENAHLFAPISWKSVYSSFVSRRRWSGWSATPARNKP